MNIPILNIYYMLVYAWDVLDEADTLRVDATDCTQLVDLFARVLHSASEAIVRRGLDRGYVPYREVIPGIRGKLDYSASTKSGLLFHGQALCEFDELTHDVHHNRILKSTIRRLLQVSDLSPAIRDELAESYFRLRQISDIELTDRTFRSLQLHRNIRHYRLPIDICQLIHRASLANENPGEREFREFFRDKPRMRRLFERFIRNFYRREQTQFRVTGNGLRWARVDGSPEVLDRLPRMRTDIRLRSTERTIVIETKYVEELFQQYFGKSTLKSSHMYQLFTYVMNLEAHRPGTRLDAILLYPEANTSCDLRYSIFGHNLHVYALNLNQPWQRISEDLLDLIQ